jgi:two-component sensor histidine kinase
LRADFLGQALDHHRPFADALQSSNLLLPPMNVQELQDTIRKPAEALNVKIEEGLTERILQEVKPASNRLPLLEFALTLLWSKQKGGRLTHASYVEIGGVEKALTDHAEQVFAELSEDEQIQAQRVFMQLVHFGEGTEDTRRLATHNEIGEENWRLVMHLSSARARLVVIGRDQISGQETVEVVHEALISGWHRLREWIENNREFRTWQERLRAAMRQWEKSNRDDGALLRGFLLTEAISWMAKYGEVLSQTERTFIDCSQQQELRQKIRDEELLRELNLRSVLTREMSFRVKNNLATVASMLSLQRRRTRSAEVRAILAESVNRIQGMASSHDLLSREDMATARIDDIARKIVGVANSNLRPLDSQITFEVHPCAVVIPSRAVTILALVLNEMISNAIKHGMTGMREGIVTIRGREEDGMVIVEVLDTGNGLPVSESLEEEDTEGLGLSLIRNLMGDIRGEFTLQRTMEIPARTCAEVRFPLS